MYNMYVKYSIIGSFDCVFSLYYVLYLYYSYHMSGAFARLTTTHFCSETKEENSYTSFLNLRKKIYMNIVYVHIIENVSKLRKRSEAFLVYLLSSYISQASMYVSTYGFKHGYILCHPTISKHDKQVTGKLKKIKLYHSY